MPAAPRRLRMRGWTRMPVWGWVVIAVAIAVAVALAVWLVMARRRTSSLRDRFGPEYDRTVQQHESRREAESELSERVRRHDELEIRPLAPEARERYLERW